MLIQLWHFYNLQTEAIHVDASIFINIWQNITRITKRIDYIDYVA